MLKNFTLDSLGQNNTLLFAVLYLISNKLYRIIYLN